MYYMHIAGEILERDSRTDGARLQQDEVSGQSGDTTAPFMRTIVDSIESATGGIIENDPQWELQRHVSNGTRPETSTETARLLLAALEIESPSGAMIEWMSQTSMELTKHVQHRRAG